MADEIGVRPFGPDDEAAIVALWSRVFPDDRPWNAPAAIVARKCAQNDGLIFVATLAGSVVGGVIAGYDGQRGWLYHLAVDATCRRRGIGRALMRAVERELGLRGCPKINLQVLPSNRDVVAFYERLGYAVEERVSMGRTLGSIRETS